MRRSRSLGDSGDSGLDVCLRATEVEEGEEYERRDSSGQNAETTNTVGGVRLSLSGRVSGPRPSGGNQTSYW